MTIVLVHLLLLIAIITSAGCSEQETGTSPSVQNQDDSIEAKLMQKWCSDCHAPPNANSHVNMGWPNVVLRMQNHRIQKGLARIPGKEMDGIISYLQMGQDNK